MDEQKFIKGFNSGYLMAEHTPDIISKLSPTVEAENPYLNGIQSGAKQYQKDKSKEKTQDQSKDKNKDHDIQMQKD